MFDIKALEKQRDEINKKINEYYEGKVKEEIEKNKAYIGRTFVIKESEAEFYHKIIDIDYTNEYRMYTFSFVLPTSLTYKITDDDVLVSIDSIGWFCNTLSGCQFKKEIERYTEISNEEYNEALEKFINILRKI